MKATHTPGPWHLGVRQAEQIVYNAEGWAIANATVYHGREEVETCKANARLIAAAPELLEACERAMQALDQMANGRTFDFAVEDTGCTARLSEAIAKARGDA